jgi:ABC-type microcin C transport system permease subunit YejB
MLACGSCRPRIRITSLEAGFTLLNPSASPEPSMSALFQHPARRVVLLVPIWFGVLTLVFLMRVLVPGDPVELMFVGQQTDPQVKANIRHQLGLDRPLPEQ